MRHFRTLMLLAIALTLAMPTFADAPSSNPTVKSAPKKPKDSGWIEQSSFQWAAGRGNSAPNPQSRKSNAPIPKLTLTPPAHNVATPMVKNPPVTDPCKAPNPPHSCKRTRPTH
jgi:hypothetical protein